MKVHPTIQRAVESLRARFGANDYSLAPIVDLATLVAAADGTIDTKESAVLNECLGVLLGEQFGPSAVEFMVRSSWEMLRDVGVEARACMVAEVLKARDAVEEGLTLALAIAYTSGGLSSEEHAAISHVARCADYAPDALDALIDRVRSAVETR